MLRLKISQPAKKLKKEISEYEARVSEVFFMRVEKKIFFFI